VVLSAVQEWNFYINSMYDAIATAMGMVQGVYSSSQYFLLKLCCLHIKQSELTQTAQFRHLCVNGSRLVSRIDPVIGIIGSLSSFYNFASLPEGDDKKNLINLTIGLVSLSGVILLAFTATLIVPILWRLLVATWNAVGFTLSSIGTAVAGTWAYLTTSGAELAAAETSEVAATAATTAATREGEEAAVAASLKKTDEALVKGATTG
jgi:hypothetical protein